MKKLTKLNLNELKVQSFVTSLEGEDSKTVKGGSSVLCFDVAVTAVFVVSVAAYVANEFALAKNRKTSSL